MLVRESTYKKALAERDAASILAMQYRDQYDSLREEWNKLVRQINAKGGADFLKGKTTKSTIPLTSEDFKKLLMLTHPDKHGGKPMAQEMTAKLLSMRDSA
jgi:hypothetical protein